MCRSAAEFDDADPWEALNGWFERFIAYIGTKRALAAELLNYMDQDAALFQVCRTSLFEAGGHYSSALRRPASYAPT